MEDNLKGIKEESPESKATLLLQGDISYSPALQRILFISKSGSLMVVHIDKEHLNELVHGESVPACVEVRY